MPWMQVYQFLKDTPWLNPPDDWENNTVPSGRHFPFYAYEYFSPEPDWEGTGKRKMRLVWGRASYWIPNQEFRIMRLRADGSGKYEPIGTLRGPLPYHSMDTKDGDSYPNVMYLEAV